MPNLSHLGVGVVHQVDEIGWGGTLQKRCSSHSMENHLIKDVHNLKTISFVL